MGHTPKGKCSVCSKRFTLILKGTMWVVPSHNKRILGQVNPECAGTDKAAIDVK